MKKKLYFFLISFIFLLAFSSISFSQYDLKTFEVQPGPSDGIDTFLDNGTNEDPNYNYGRSPIWMAYSDKLPLLIKFDFSSISRNVTVVSSTISLYSIGHGGSIWDIYAWRVSSGNAGWVEGNSDSQIEMGASCWNYHTYNTRTWAGQPGLTEPDVDYITPAMGGVTGLVTTGWIDIVLSTQQVKEWLVENYGAKINYTSGSGGRFWKYCCLSDYLDNPSLRPKFSITYIPAEPPYPVTDLSAEQTGNPGEVRLTWTYPGPYILSNISKYQIQISTYPEVMWSTGNLSNIIISTSSVFPGSIESIVLSVDASTTNYFRLWIADEVPYWSVVSNLTSISVPIDTSMPEQITDFLVTSISIRTGEGRVKLSWTAPREDSPPLQINKPVAGYIIKYATFSAESLSGNTTAWWNSANFSFNLGQALQPGTTEILQYPQFPLLTPGLTYYFGIKSYDEPWDAVPEALTSLVDKKTESVTEQTRVYGKDTDFAPYAPSNLKLQYMASYYMIIKWDELSNEGKTSDFNFYRIYRSTEITNYGIIVGISYSNTFCDDNSLTPGLTYYYRVSGVDAPPVILESPLSSSLTCYFSGECPDKSPPYPVTDLFAVTTSSEAEIEVSWTVPVELESSLKNYYIKYSTFSVDSLSGNTTNWWNSISSTITVSARKQQGEYETYRFNFPSLTPGLTYYFAIKTSDIYDNISLIDINSQTPGGQARAWSRDIPPGKPEGLTILELTTGYVKLVWSDLSEEGKTVDFDFYRIYRSTTPQENGSPIMNVGTNFFTDTNITVNTTYYWRISGIDKPPVILEGALSEPVTCFIEPPPPEKVPPEPVTDLSAKTTGLEAEVEISWTAPFEDGSGLKEYYIKFATFSCESISGGTTKWWENILTTYTVVANVSSGNKENCIISFPYLYPGNTYYFAIKACDKSDNISLIDINSQTPGGQARAWSRDIPPGKPEGLTILELTTGYVRLSWSDLSEEGKTVDFDFYRIYRSTKQGEIGNAVGTASGTSYTDTAVMINTTYYWRISGVDRAPLVLEGELSEPVTGYTEFIDKEPPESITDLVAQETLNEGEIELYWSVPLEKGIGLQKYYIRYGTFSVDDLGLGTTVWWDMVNKEKQKMTVKVSGEQEEEIIKYPEIMPGASYYFGIKSEDKYSNVSDIDVKSKTGMQAVGFARDIVPQTPEGLVIMSVTTSFVKLSWYELSEEGKTVDFDFYRIYRSTQGNQTGVVVYEGQGIPYTDNNVQVNLTYYYWISAVDKGPLVLESELSMPVTCYITPGPPDITPPEGVTNLSGLTLDGEAVVKLLWTAPVEEGSGLKEYYIKSSSFSVDSIGGNTTVWWQMIPSTWVYSAKMVSGRDEVVQIEYPVILPGLTYYFGIKAVDVSNNISVIDINSQTPGGQARAWSRDIPPGKPEGLTILELTTGYVRLSWSDLSEEGKTVDFDFYRIYRSTKQGEIGNAVGTASGTSYTDTAVMINTTYYWRISGVDRAPLVLEGELSEPVTFYFKFEDITPPQAITDLLAVSTTDEAKIHIIWTAPYEKGSGLKEYYIKFSTFSIIETSGNTTLWWQILPGTYTKTASVAPGNIEEIFFNYPAILPGVTYYFGIKSIDNFNNLSSIDVKSESPITQAHAYSNDFTPSTPYGLTILEVTTGFVKLSWSDLTSKEKTLDFDFYRIYRSTTPGISGIVISQIQDNSFQDTSVSVAVTYYYRISGVDKEPLILESNLSEPVTCYIFPPPPDIIPPQPVTDLTALTTVNEAEVQLIWTAPEEVGYGLKEYKVRFATFSIDSLSGNTTLWWDISGRDLILPVKVPQGNKQNEVLSYPDLPAGVTCYFSIKAVDYADNCSVIDLKSSQPSLQAKAFSRDFIPQTPAGLTVLEATTNFIKISWNELSYTEKTVDFSFYRVYKATSPAGLWNIFREVNSPGITDTDVVWGATYYYKISAVDAPPVILESPLSNYISRCICPPLVYKISGYVRDVSSNGVSGITINLEGYETYKVVTDNNGYYEFIYLTPLKNYKVTPQEVLSMDIELDVRPVLLDFTEVRLGCVEKLAFDVIDKKKYGTEIKFTPVSISTDSLTHDLTMNFTASIKSIKKTGDYILKGTANPDNNWIITNPVSFEGPYNTINVDVDNNILGKRTGEFTGKIIVETNAGTAEVTVKFTATCVLARPNPYITGSGNLEFFGSGIVPYNTHIKIWTVSGELVSILKENKGERKITWDGKNIKGIYILPGIYIYTYESPKEKGAGKFTVRSR